MLGAEFVTKISSGRLILGHPVCFRSDSAKVKTNRVAQMHECNTKHKPARQQAMSCCAEKSKMQNCQHVVRQFSLAMGVSE